MKKKQMAKSATKRLRSQCVRLELRSPGARQVYVAGSFNDWCQETTPLIDLGEGQWAKELTLPPGRYEYRFVVDGQWMDDPKAREFVPNPHGGQNALLVVEPLPEQPS